LRAALAAADPQAIAAQLRDGGAATIGGLTLSAEELLVSVEDPPGMAVASEEGGGLAVAVDTELTDALRAEGFARELVHRVQNMRRDAGFDIADRIVTYVDGADAGTLAILEAHGAYLRQETLSVRVAAAPPPGGAHAERHAIEDTELTIGVTRAADTEA
ncbi:MAG: isoleucine--tRNA ligase, partial [Dehalococcoidia bacterium]|nr:isoleucine--tRNA ligase [Dehalococcoidia bacterium]